MFIRLNREESPRLRCVGRLKRNCYMYKGSLVSTQTFTVLKRKSQLQLEDLICDASYDIDQLNLNQYEEGVYEIATTNVSEFEGIVDEWDLKLVPYKEDKDVLGVD